MSNDLSELKALRDSLVESHTKTIEFFDKQIEKLSPFDFVRFIESKTKGFADRIYKLDPILSALQKQGNIKPLEAGQIPKQCSAQVIVSGLERLVDVVDKEALADMMKPRIEATFATLQDRVISSLYARENKNPLAMDGLLEAVPYAEKGVFPDIKRNFALGVRQVETAGGKCDLIVVGKNVFSKFLNTLDSDKKTGNQEYATRGFMCVNFQGIPIIFENRVDEDHAYFLSTQHLELRPHVDRTFTTLEQGEPIPPTPTHAIVWAGNFFSTKPVHRLLEMKEAV